jgi:hypothetical protein
MQHHPDRGGDTATMAEINAEFEYVINAKLFQERKKHESRRQAEEQAEGREWKGNFMSSDEMQTISDKLFQAYIRVAYLDDLIFEVCGDWLWVSGATRTHKDALKAAGFWWASQKAAWYVQGSKSSGRGGWSMDKIRQQYGSSKVEDKDKPARLKTS